MQDDPGITEMIHYQCYTCGVSATCVSTPTADLAWLDHMENHAEKKNFGRWTWGVRPMTFS